jgi:GcrA cell cycle regulator
MEPGQWPSEHSDALRDYFLRGLSYAEIGQRINARFGTAYTRNAVIGRAKRLGLITPSWMASPSIVPMQPGEACRSLPRRSAPPSCLHLPPKSAMQPAAPVKLRCVGVSPRLIPLDALERNDCRYAYGGDKEGEDIVFCGHPRRPGSSYCAPHAWLTRRSGAAARRVTVPFVPRLVSSV